PVGVRHDMMTSDFTSRFNLPASRHGPVKQRVEPCDTLSARQRLDVLEEGRKAPDDLAPVEILRHFKKSFQRNACLAGAPAPGVGPDFPGLEFTLQRRQNPPLQ